MGGQVTDRAVRELHLRQRLLDATLDDHAGVGFGHRR
jgi:hypothetical protein